MTFAAKYEILEVVARGTVETFVARKLATDEPVLVHIFECQEQQPNQPTVQWVLESFRIVAPEPCGLVVETGRYEATSYGYLVARLPDKSALQAWIQAYNARQQAETGVVPPPPSIATPDSPESTKPVTHVPRGSEETTLILGFDRAEEIVTEFEALRPELKPSSGANLSPSGVPRDHAHPDARSGELRGFGLEDPAVVQSEISDDLTTEFFSELGEDQGNAPAHLSCVPPRQEPCGPTDPFSAAGTQDREPTAADIPLDTPSGIFPKIVPGSPNSIKLTVQDTSSRSDNLPQAKPIPSSASSKTAELTTVTSFFPGPFNGPRSETHDRRAVASEEKETVDFTRPFTTPEVDSSAQLAASPSAKHPAAASDPGSFTKLFESIALLKRTSGEYRADLQSENRTDASCSIPFTAKGQSSPAPISGSAKTRVDSLAPPTSSESASALSVLAAGPSEYTRIISGGLKKPGASGELPDRAGQHGSAGSATQPPAATSPQLPPAGGQSEVPSPRQIPVLPVAQRAPLATAGPKAAGPPWTMILILNGLFILAVLLVLYFVFRH